MLLAIGILCPTLNAWGEGAGPNASASYSYQGLTEVDGHIEGRCRGHQFDLAQNGPGAITVVGRLIPQLHRMSFNSTYAMGQMVVRTEHFKPTAVYTDRKQATIRWDAGATVFVSSKSLEPASDSPFDVTFQGTHAVMESAPQGRQGGPPPLNAFPTTPNDPGQFALSHFMTGTRLVHLDGALSIPAHPRFFSIFMEGNVTVESADGSVIYLRHAISEENAAGFVVQRSDIFYRFYIKVYDPMSLEFPAGHWTVGCSSLDLWANGDARTTSANGRADLLSTTVPFKNKNISMAGTFHVRETVADVTLNLTHDDRVPYPVTEQGRGNGGTVSGYADGTLTTMAVGGFSVLGSALHELSSQPPIIVGTIIAFAAAAKHLGSIVGYFYARFGPSRALDHPRRRAILEAVASQPGITLGNLVSGLGWSFNDVKYHLGVLRRTGHVRVARWGRFVHVWPAGARHDDDERTRNALLATRPQLARLDSLLQEGPRASRDVLERLQSDFGLTRSGARNVIRRALGVGMIEKNGPNLARRKL